MIKTYTNHKGIKSVLRTPPDTGNAEIKDSTTQGLYLRLYSTGLGVFVHRYKFGKKRRVYTFPEIAVRKTDTERVISASLKKARAEHAQQKVQLRGGEDPAIERDLVAEKIQGMPTVREFAETYIEKYAKLTKKSWKEDQRMLNVDVIPYLGYLKLDKVETKHVIGLLVKKQDAGHLVARNRLISLLSKFFNVAIVRACITSVPMVGVKRTKETKKRRYLSEAEIVYFWESTGKDSNLSYSNRLALRMILVTGQRPSEVCDCMSHKSMNSVYGTLRRQRTKSLKTYLYQIQQWKLSNRLDYTVLTVCSFQVKKAG